MKIANIFLFGMLIFFLSGCAAPSTKAELDRIQTIGVQNEFGDIPTWTVIGTTVFTNEFSQVDPRDYKSHLTNSVLEYLQKKGYKAKEIPKTASGQDSDVDLILKLVPWNAERFVGTQGYGFVERSFLGLKAGPFAYVVMHIYPFVKDKSGYSERRGTYQEQFEKLTIREMPRTWSELSAATKNDLESSLKTCIDRSLNLQLPQLGL